MVMIRTIQIRLTRQQYERIKNESRIRGFNSLSAYIRYQALQKDEAIERKIYEIHQAVGASPNNRKNKKYPLKKNEI